MPASNCNFRGSSYTALAGSAHLVHLETHGCNGADNPGAFAAFLMMAPQGSQLTWWMNSGMSKEDVFDPEQLYEQACERAAHPDQVVRVRVF